MPALQTLICNLVCLKIPGHKKTALCGGYNRCSSSIFIPISINITPPVITDFLLSSSPNFFPRKTPAIQMAKVIAAISSEADII